jgi:predicted TPR repeat methyltransferase
MNGNKPSSADHQRSASPPAGELAARRFAAALQQFRAGNLAQAGQQCRDLLADAPDHVEGLHLLGLIAYRSGEPAVAVDQFEAALRRDPGFAKAHVSLGNVFTEQGRLTEAAAQYRLALALQPHDPMIIYNLANVLARQGGLAEAVACYRQALVLRPGAGDIMNNLATALQDLGEVEQACGLYERAAALAPSDPRLHNNMGNALARLGRFDAAKASFERALALDAGFVEAHDNLGQLLQRQGRTHEALACFERAFGLAPDNVACQLDLCAALYALSLTEPAKAAGIVNRLLADHSHRPLLWRGLAGLAGDQFDPARDADYARALFDRFAPSFDKTLAGLGYLAMPEAIAETLGLADATATFDTLDAGCGTGLCGTLLRRSARSLVGVDLSPRMLAKAQASGVYDQLIEADAMAFMLAHPGAFDLIVSSDVLTYVGDAKAFALAAGAALRPGGRLAVSVEILAAHPSGVQLSPSGRYLHGRDHIQRCLGAAGLRIATVRDSVMRREAGVPAKALIAVAERPPAG